MASFAKIKNDFYARLSLHNHKIIKYMVTKFDICLTTFSNIKDRIIYKNRIFSKFKTFLIQCSVSKV